MPRLGDTKQTSGDCWGLTVLSLVVLAVLLIVDGVKQSRFLVLLWTWRTLYDSYVLGVAGI
jgi:hypothetical protein